MLKIKDYIMQDGFVAIKPVERDDLQPELNKYNIRTIGTIVLSNEPNEVGFNVIYDGTQSVSVEQSDIEIIPEKAILAFSRRKNG